MPARPALLVLPDADGVYGAAARLIADGLAAAIDARGVAHWSTTGGSAAPGIYRALRAAPLRHALDWSRVHTWWGDDRYVLPGDPLSNVTPFTDVMLDPAAGLVIPDANIHPITGPIMVAYKWANPAWLAEAYASQLKHDVGHPEVMDGLPVFDLIILGVGPDGHILSVFPGSTVFDSDAWVESVPAPTHVEPHVPRVTVNPRLVAAARSVLVLTAGASKADVLARAWAGGDVRELPVRATLLPQATWVLDEAAATGLPGR